MRKHKIKNKHKARILNIETSVFKFAIWVLNLFCALNFIICHPAFAQGSDKLAGLTKQIIEAKAPQELYAHFEEAGKIYFQEHNYNDFIEFLNSLLPQNKIAEPFVEYYTALGRYQQLKYLEETQSWDEYFAQGNTYRQQITDNLTRLINSGSASQTLGIRARLLLWKLHSDQHDAFEEAALSDLTGAILEYSRGPGAKAALIKEIAGQLLSHGEKEKSRELYKLYVGKLLASDISDDGLRTSAGDFYEKGNLELAEATFDVYIERIIKSGMPRDKLTASLADIARLFSYKDKALHDPAYAEKVWKKVEEAAGQDAFNEELMYLRAFNLEKSKDYQEAAAIYLDFIQAYPQSKYTDEAHFKIGLISVYILKDIQAAREHFKKLTQQEKASPQSISSFYQLGLFSQWEDSPDQAQAYYRQLLEKSKGEFLEAENLAKQRLQEIEAGKPLEYNLKVFLDASLKDEYAALSMARTDLNASLAQPGEGEPLQFNAGTYALESGCMQVELQYLWSGDLGKASAVFNQAVFDTSYAQPGTKAINLVLVSPAGIVSRDFVLVDVR